VESSPGRLREDARAGRQPSRAAEAAEASRKSEAAEASRSPGATSGGAAGGGAAALDPRSYPAKKRPAADGHYLGRRGDERHLAYLFALLAICIGVPYVPCVVGHTQPGEPAWRANLQPRDRIVEINGLKNPASTTSSSKWCLPTPARDPPGDRAPRGGQQIYAGSSERCAPTRSRPTGG